jgi:hypothetical protein
MSTAENPPRPSLAKERRSTITQCRVRRPRNRNNRLDPARAPAGEGIVHICSITVFSSTLHSTSRSLVNEQGSMMGMVKNTSTSGREISSSKGLVNSLLLLDCFL